MIPCISYKDYIKNAKDKTKARESLKEHILETGGDISLWATSLQVDIRTIKKLLENDDLNYEAKKVPKHSPNKIPESTEDLIEQYREQSGYGPDMLKLNYNIPHSTSTIYRVLKERELIKNPQRAYIRRQENRRIRKKLRAFEKWQLDTKDLGDIPNLIAPIYQGIVPKYEYTLRDMVTGTSFLGFALHNRSVFDTSTFVALCLYHMQLHGIDTHYVTVQSDNGSEIIGNITKKERYYIERVVEDQFGGRFRTIPVASPTFNSHVESFHGRIEKELYDRMSINENTNFTKEVREFVCMWNTQRRDLTRKKTPQMKAKEYGYDLPECFFNFPVLIYDIIPEHLEQHYLSDDLTFSKISNILSCTFSGIPSIDLFTKPLTTISSASS